MGSVPCWMRLILIATMLVRKGLEGNTQTMLLINS